MNKNFRVNLKKARNLHTEHYKILQKKIKNINKWKQSRIHELEDNIA